MDRLKADASRDPRAALLALAAIALWGFLALLSSRLGKLPPLLMTGIALTVGGMVGLLKVRDWKVPARTFVIGVGGIFGYHFLLFTGFRHAPTVEANLINYLWPLLIVVLSPVILTGYSLRPRHVLGALAGLAGAALIVSGGSFRPDAANLPGYAAAAGAALVWAVYSLLTKRLPTFPSGAVGGFCLAAGLLALSVSLVEYGPAGFAAIGGLDWLFLVLLGLGPMGTAFFLWDASLKRGDPRVIGSLSYLTPLLSTLALVAIGGKPFTALSAAAMALIIAGAVIGSLPRKTRQKLAQA
ncbi:MAG TPA: DMT family transporter [Spirochaetia bacterium]|nr:DMT family transporter [Spirochaetia bacterium]